MIEIEKIVKELRGKYIAYDVTGNHNSAHLYKDAADAIEELTGFLAEAERDRDEYEERMRKEQERVIELQAEADALAHDIERYVGINAELTTEIEALQAEVKILKVSGREAYFEGLAADDNGRQVEKLAKRNAELHAELERWVSAAEQAGEPKRGEIVRCGECRYRITAHGISDGWVLCSKPYTERGNAMHRADWFCADGEREAQDG